MFFLRQKNYIIYKKQVCIRGIAAIIHPKRVCLSTVHRIILKQSKGLIHQEEKKISDLLLFYKNYCHGLILYLPRVLPHQNVDPEKLFLSPLCFDVHSKSFVISSLH